VFVFVECSCRVREKEGRDAIVEAKGGLLSNRMLVKSNK
jgi:hypothetical protein